MWQDPKYPRILSRIFLDLSPIANILKEVQEVFNHKNQVFLDLTFQTIVRITQYLHIKKPGQNSVLIVLT